MPPKKFTIEIYRTDRGMWVAVSDQLQGLYVCHDTLSDVMIDLPHALRVALSKRPMVSELGR